MFSKEWLDKFEWQCKLEMVKDKLQAKKIEYGISSSELVDMLAFAKIIINGKVFECTEICAKAEDGTTWHIMNFAKCVREQIEKKDNLL